MPIVAFWSTQDSAQLCSTATATAVAMMIATKMRNKYKTLVTQTNYSDMSLENSFFNPDKRNKLDTSDTGIDALDRLLRSNKLTPENIPNYATPILKGSLELLYGTFKNDTDSYSRILETMPIIIDYANQFYDIVLVDLNKGYETSEINSILQKSDLIVFNMSQNKNILKKLFKDMNTLKILQEKPVIPVLGRYDRYSTYNEKNIARSFNYKKRIYTIPYNTQFFDSCNQGNAARFFIENANANMGTDRNGFFISEVAELTDAIIEAIKPKMVDR